MGYGPHRVVGLTGQEGSSMALVLVQEFKGPKGSARVAKDTQWQEYCVTMWDEAGHCTGTYYTDDRENAISSARVMCGLDA